MRRALSIAPILFASTVAAAAPTPADSKLPAQLEGIGIVDQPGAKLPVDLDFVDQDGKPVRLGDYLDGKKPLLLQLAYYQCPMLCSIVMNGLVEGLRGLDFTAGRDYRILAVSIDPRDTQKLAQAKHQNYLESLGLTAPVPRAWDFLIQAPGDPRSVQRLADTVGFRYRWDEKTQQFAHAAGVFLFTPDGRLSRTLYGIQFPKRDLRLALVEASQGKLGGAWDKVLLFCYHYEPGEGYTVAVLNIMRLGGVLTVLAVAGVIVYFLRREKSRRTGAEPKAA